MAKLHFKYGAMNCGKTDLLIKTAYNYIENHLNIIVIKPAVDTKGGGQLISRAGLKRNVDILPSPSDNIRLLIKDFIKTNNLKKVHIILIDEAQFLLPRQVDQLLKVAKIDNISVIAYGLKVDFRSRLFKGSKRLIELSDQIEKIPTMCHCGNQAEFNCRMVNKQVAFKGNWLAIDGKDEVEYSTTLW